MEKERTREVQEEEIETPHVFSPWDTEFVNVDKVTLFELINAANYLAIKGLYELTGKAIANRLSEMTIEEVRKFLNVKNDFTPAQEEQIRKENKWIKENAENWK